MSFWTTAFRPFASGNWGGRCDFRLALSSGAGYQPNNAVDPQTLGQTWRGQIGSMALRPQGASILHTLTGISKDSAGVALGTCQILVFTTADKRLVVETVSDASGNWSVPLYISGPFFTVEYKVGSPDVAGTSVNTLVPV